MQPGQPNMQQILQQAQQMQQQLVNAQQELAAAEVTGTAGGGLVTATVTGAGELKALDIDPKVHPAWTGGNARLLNEGGQVARFNKRFGGLTLGKK